MIQPCVCACLSIHPHKHLHKCIHTCKHTHAQYFSVVLDVHGKPFCLQTRKPCLLPFPSILFLEMNTKLWAQSSTQAGSLSFALSVDEKEVDENVESLTEAVFLEGTGMTVITVVRNVTTNNRKMFTYCAWEWRKSSGDYFVILRSENKGCLHNFCVLPWQAGTLQKN